LTESCRVCSHMHGFVKKKDSAPSMAGTRSPKNWFGRGWDSTRDESTAALTGLWEMITLTSEASRWSTWNWKSQKSTVNATADMMQIIRDGYSCHDGVMIHGHWSERKNCMSLLLFCLRKAPTQYVTSLNRIEMKQMKLSFSHRHRCDIRKEILAHWINATVWMCLTVSSS
jgi:hypothetical protein